MFKNRELEWQEYICTLNIDLHRRSNSPGSPARCVAVPAACWVHCETGDWVVSCLSCGLFSLLYSLVVALEKDVKVPEEVAGSHDLWIGPLRWWMSSSSCFFLRNHGRPVYLQAGSWNWESLIGKRDTCYSILSLRLTVFGAMFFFFFLIEPSVVDMLFMKPLKYGEKINTRKKTYP